MTRYEKNIDIVMNILDEEYVDFGFFKENVESAVGGSRKFRKELAKCKSEAEVQHLVNQYV